MNKKVLPHIEDAQMDILNVARLEHRRDIALRRLGNGAEVVKPLSWEEMGIPVKPSRQARKRLA